jgi:hypothetical protein
MNWWIEMQNINIEKWIFEFKGWLKTLQSGFLNWENKYTYWKVNFWIDNEDINIVKWMFELRNWEDEYITLKSELISINIEKLIMFLRGRI